jgi:transcriptional regulator with XRE-family HTH domain
MHLRDYLIPEGRVRGAHLARKMGVGKATISRLAKGDIQPSAEMLRKLFAATDGAVTPNDMLGITGGQGGAPNGQSAVG